MSQQHSEELQSPNNSQNIRNIEEQISSILPSEAIPNETKEEEIRKEWVLRQTLVRYGMYLPCTKMMNQQRKSI